VSGPARQGGALKSCQFCRNRAAWVYRPCRWWVCSSCRVAVEQRQWDTLAARWLRAYPRVWVPELAKVIEANLDGRESRSVGPPST
jgi:hypothetical protein